MLISLPFSPLFSPFCLEFLSLTTKRVLSTSKFRKPRRLVEVTENKVTAVAMLLALMLLLLGMKFAGYFRVMSDLVYKAASEKDC